MVFRANLSAIVSYANLFLALWVIVVGWLFAADVLPDVHIGALVALIVIEGIGSSLVTLGYFISTASADEIAKDMKAMRRNTYSLLALALIALAFFHIFIPASTYYTYADGHSIYARDDDNRASLLVSMTFQHYNIAKMIFYIIMGVLAVQNIAAYRSRVVESHSAQRSKNATRTGV